MYVIFNYHITRIIFEVSIFFFIDEKKSVILKNNLDEDSELESDN